jgi:sarcosine oxidase
MGGEVVRTDVAVVGCGAAGLAAAAELARRGRQVVGLDRFEHGHTRGSSHGTERIVRVPYTDPVHVEMVLASIEGWRRIEQAADTTLLTSTGGIDAGSDDELGELAAMCARAGVATTRFTAAEAADRFVVAGRPMFEFTTDVLHHELAATVHADRTLVALRGLAAAAGAGIRPGVEVTGLDLLDDGTVEVRHPGGRVVADTCVVTTGAWGGDGGLATALEGLAVVPPMRVTQEQVAFFEPRREGRSGASWPTFIFREEPSIYGLPTPDGLVKIGEHHTGPAVDPDTRSGEVDPATWHRLLDWVRCRVPGVDPAPVGSVTCLYASFPGDTFLLDRAGPIVVGLGLSGHGFKFVPEVGRRLADLADGVPWPGNPFGFDRPVIGVGASGQR